MKLDWMGGYVNTLLKLMETAGLTFWLIIPSRGHRSFPRWSEFPELVTGSKITLDCSAEMIPKLSEPSEGLGVKGLAWDYCKVVAKAQACCCYRTVPSAVTITDS